LKKEGLELSHHGAVRAVAQILEDLRINRFRKKTDAAVGQAKLRASVMMAAKSAHGERCRGSAPT